MLLVVITFTQTYTKIDMRKEAISIYCLIICDHKHPRNAQSILTQKQGREKDIVSDES